MLCVEPTATLLLVDLIVFESFVVQFFGFSWRGGDRDNVHTPRTKLRTRDFVYLFFCFSRNIQEYNSKTRTTLEASGSCHSLSIVNRMKYARCERAFSSGRTVYWSVCM